MRGLVRVLLVLALVATVALGVFLSTYPGSQSLHYALYLLRARSAEEMLGDPATPPSVRRSLENLGEARAYAASLGLDVGDSYSTVSDDGGGPLVWVVTAAPPDRLEPVTWRYPVVGALSYRGFFRRDEADRFALGLEGMDTWVRGAPAFSALGMFPEPLPSSVLGWDREGLVGLVVHETLHRTVFFPGRTDFNETLATFVERRALLDRSEDPAALRERWSRSERAHARLQQAAEELRAVYRDHPGQALHRRTPVFDALARDLEAIRGRPDPEPWNNARLLGSLAYVGGLDEMEEVYRRLDTDLPGFIRFFAGLDPSGDPRAQVEARVGKL